MDLGKLTEGIAELKKIMESLAAVKDPVAEHQEEVSKMGDSKLLAGIAGALKVSVEKFEEISKGLAEKLEVKPEISHEELEALKAKVAEGEKAIAQLAELEAEKLLTSRLAQLAEAGVAFEGEKAEAQKTRVKAMSDEAFLTYKEDLSEAQKLKEVKEVAKAKAEADEKAKLEAAEAEKAKEKAEADAKGAVPGKADLKDSKEHQDVLNAAQAGKKEEETGRSKYAAIFKA